MAPQRASSSSTQRPITCFFQGHQGQNNNAAARSTTTTRKRRNGSMFGKCPLCQVSFPLHKLEHHAADCTGNGTTTGSKKEVEIEKRPRRPEEDRGSNANANLPSVAVTMNEPLPGLFLYENFITEEEEAQILAELDGESMNHEYLPWKESTFNGKHFGKRWGVHCNLHERKVTPAEHPLPHFVQKILLPKLAQLLHRQQQQDQQQQEHCGPLKRNKNCMSDFIPNEANAIDYRRDQVHYLKDHVDDRQLSKEPIANISLAGDCYMTFTNVKASAVAAAAAMASSGSCHSSNKNMQPRVCQVLLPRRCLQILTGQARYDYSHGIQHCHLLSPRRVSVTMRESPLTAAQTKDRPFQAAAAAVPCAASKTSSSSLDFFKAREAKKTAESSLTIPPTVSLRRVSTGSPAKPWTEQPIPGLYLFHDFITPEEERVILQELDRPESATWKTERHSGTHFEKRWGMDHDLWSPAVRPPKHPLPNFLESIIIPKLKHLPAMVMQGCIPNEVNSIDYRRQLGHSLKSHADDRKKYKEPIANLSLAGDCIMTYRNESKHRNNLDVSEKRVLLQRRCLQVLTGKARYDFAHGIANHDLLSDRRVSLTMREMRL